MYEAYLFTALLTHYVTLTTATWPTDIYGHAPIARDDTEVASSQTQSVAIIPEPNNPIRRMGHVKSVRIYGDANRAQQSHLIRLQIWKPNDESGSNMYTVVGETHWSNDLSPGTVKEYNVEGLFVEPGQLLGINYYYVNPIPYGLSTPCASGDQSLSTTTADMHMHLTLQFSSLGECRHYSAQLELSYYDCTELEATSSTQTIRSQNYPTNYPHNLDVCWILTSSIDDYHVQLNIQSFDTEHCHDYVKMLDGSVISSPFITLLCGSSRAGSVYTSTGPSLMLIFHTDSSIARNGFEITFTAVEEGESNSGCMSLTVPSSGLPLHSPNYPDDYHNDLYVCYIVSADDPDDPLDVHFDTMDIEHHSNCAFDALEIRDGSNEHSPLLGRFCGQYQPSTLYSSRGSLYIEFFTDSSVTNSGFSLHIIPSGTDATTEDCIHLDADSDWRDIETDNYPDNYPANIDQWCYVIVQASEQIQIQVLNSELQSPVEGAGCIADFMEVRDGDDVYSPLLWRWCGHDHPHVITSSDHRLFIRFRSDNELEFPGVRLQYKQYSGAVGCTPTSVHHEVATLSSPGFPNTYDDNMDVCWFIQAFDDLERVTIEFTAFQLEHESNCGYDVLHIYDGPSPTSPMFGSFCGARPPSPFVSSGREVYLRFTTDGSIGHPGFSFQYQSVDYSDTEFCTTYYANDYVGSLHSPFWPNNYEPDMSICWTIQAWHEHFEIQVVITEMELEGDQDACALDYLEIRDGRYPASDLLGLFCGSVYYKYVKTTQRYAYIAFKSDSTVQSTGFRLDFHEEDIVDDDPMWGSHNTTVALVALFVVLGIIGLAIVYCTYKICSKKALVHAQLQAQQAQQSPTHGVRANAYATSQGGTHTATATTVFGNDGYTDFSMVSASGYPPPGNPAAFPPYEGGGMYNPLYHHNHVAPPPAYAEDIPPMPESKGAP